MAGRAWRPMLVALCCGLLAALSQPPVSLPWVLGLSLPVLFILWTRAATPRRAFAIGWAAGVGYFGAGLHWIAEPFLVDAATFGWMIPFAMLGVSTGFALFWGTGFWLAKRIAYSTNNDSLPRWGAPFALTGGWLVLEWLRGNILTGFPWGLLGYAWIETPAMQSAAWVGIYGVTLWTVLAGTFIGAAIVARGLTSSLIWAAAAIAIVTVAWFDGLGSEAATPNPAAPLIGLVQPNVPQKEKWRPELREAQFNDLLAKTKNLSDRGADVVIWPEAASPYAFTGAPNLREQMAAALKPDGVLLAGGLRFENAGTADQQVFNSLIAVGGNGDLVAVYDKQHLVPFGEFLPFDDFLTSLGLRAMAALPGGMSAGNGEGRHLSVPGLPPFVPMICYETIFPAEIMPLNSDAEWLVQVTNDAWFGRIAGPYQHLAQARVRAIERGLPLARAANTGVSAIIDSRGKLLSELPLNQSGVLLQRLPGSVNRTLYTGAEDAPFGLIIVLCILLGRAERSRKL